MRLIHPRSKRNKEDRTAFRRFSPIAATILIPAFIGMTLLGKAEAKDAKVVAIKNAADVNHYLVKPVDVKDGKIEGMRIAVPLPKGDKDTYIVIEVSSEALQQLMESAKSPQDIRDWIIQNQRRMLEQGRTTKETPEDVPMLRRTKATRPPVTAKIEATNPIPPIVKGGTGIEEDPIRMDIPVPVEDKALVGTVLCPGDLSVLVDLLGDQRRFYIKARFVAVEPTFGTKPRKTTKRQLALEISRVVASRINQQLRADGKRDMSIPTKGVVGTADKFIAAARGKHGAISHYLSR